MVIIEGAIALKAVLASKYRKVNKIYIEENKNSNDITYILQQAKKAHVEVKRCKHEEIVSLASGKTHGGILAEVSERKFQSIASLLYEEKPFLALIEGVEDGFNLGYIMRTLYAFGCDGVILKQHEYDFDDPTIIKSSAGASELLPITFSNDFQTTFDILKANNVKIVSAYRGKNPINLYDYEFKDQGLLICVGGPLRGLSSVVLNNSDDFIYIPYANDFKNALNAASAVSVIAGEVYRQTRRED